VRLVFADTGAFYALVDRKDPAHDRARRYYEAESGVFLTTDFVFAETMSLVTKRVGKEASVRLGRAILESDRVRIEDPSPEVREAAWQLFSGHLDKDYDLIDCISFALMDARGIGEVFGFDRHFAQRGCRLLPEPA